MDLGEAYFTSWDDMRGVLVDGARSLESPTLSASGMKEL
jgi:hypothetical protein